MLYSDDKLLSSWYFGTFDRYNHVETLTLNFHTNFQWFNGTLSSFVFPNVCHLSLLFPNDDYDSDRDGNCTIIHNHLSTAEYNSVWIFLNEILPLSKLQSLTMFNLLPKNYLIQLLSSTTNLTTLKIDDWQGETSNLTFLCRVLIIKL